MHGIVFASLADYLQARGLRDELSIEYERDRVYPDEDLRNLLERVSARTHGTLEDVLRDFGRFLGSESFPRLAPSFYEQHGSLIDALLDVEEEIHEQVRAVVPNAVPPHLRVIPLGRLGVVIAYTSERRLCALLEGLVEGTAERYDTAIRIEHPQCMLRGEPACSIVVELA